MENYSPVRQSSEFELFQVVTVLKIKKRLQGMLLQLSIAFKVRDISLILYEISEQFRTIHLYINLAHGCKFYPSAMSLPTP